MNERHLINRITSIIKGKITFLLIVSVILLSVLIVVKPLNFDGVSSKLETKSQTIINNANYTKQRFQPYIDNVKEKFII